MDQKVVKRGYQKNMRDESKDNAPYWESAKGGLATFVDQVEDKHLVQIEDHPAQMLQSKLFQPLEHS